MTVIASASDTYAAAARNALTVTVTLLRSLRDPGPGPGRDSKRTQIPRLDAASDSESVRVIPSQCESFRVIPSQSESFRVIPSHSESV